MSTTFERLKEIIVNLTGIPEQIVKPEASLEDDLCLDSLDMIEIVMAAEDEFGTVVEDDVLEQIKTVQDAVSAIDASLSEKQEVQSW